MYGGCIIVHCSVLQCVAVYCSAMECVAAMVILTARVGIGNTQVRVNAHNMRVF